MALDPTGIVHWAVRDCLDRVFKYVAEANKYRIRCQELQKYLEQIRPMVQRTTARNSQSPSTSRAETGVDTWLSTLAVRLEEAERVLGDALEWARLCNVVRRTLSITKKKKVADKIRVVTEGLKKMAEHEIPFATLSKVLDLETTIIGFSMHGGKFANGGHLADRMGRAERKMKRKADEALVKVAEEPGKVHEMQRVVEGCITKEMTKIIAELLREEPRGSDEAKVDAVLQRLTRISSQVENSEAVQQQGGPGEQLQVSHSVKDIKVATKNFSTKIGQGGEFSVYSGVLSDGRKVAVKVANIRDHSYIPADLKLRFLRELELMALCRHENILTSHGYCIATKVSKMLWRTLVKVKWNLESELSSAIELMLITELAENGSVHDYLNRETLDWQQRLCIIADVARGLVYLHHDSGLSILHRDIKPSNIFLDDKMRSKIGDFGISVSLKLQGDSMCEPVIGTKGFLAPEVFGGVLSLAADVYSFGVTVMYIVSGKAFSAANMPAWVAKLMRQGLEEEILDSRLARTSYLEAEVSRVLHVALLCTQTERGLRPNMQQVLSMLLGETKPEPSVLELLQAEEGRQDEITTTSGKISGRAFGRTSGRVFDSSGAPSTQGLEDGFSAWTFV